MGQGLEIASEIDAIADLGLDIAGMSEAKKPWNAKNKWEYDMMMDVAPI